MRSHNGMRPQDIVVLLKIMTTPTLNWQYRDMASDLFLSVSEISDSLNRSHMAGLVDESRRLVFRQSLMEFIEHGIHYVFPQNPGTMVTGVPTAHSHTFFKAHFKAELDYVWPDTTGWARGLSVLPLYKGVTKAILKDDRLYRLLAAIDIIRVGKTRELKLALTELRKTILNES
jgi:hypothetical protein